MIWSKKLIHQHITKVLVKKIIFLQIIILTLILQTSCQQEVPKSFLIIAFDQLSPDKLNCSDERNYENSGFSIICKESIRFTHAYTTSLQPAAAITSVLTGQYPITHGVHRSFDRIKSDQVTLAEAAFKSGYRTAFYGGTPHVLKKTGLSKYFEIFDDSAGALYSQQIIRDFKTTSQDFYDWAIEDKTPFFAVLTNAEIEAFNDQDTNLTSYEKLDDKLYQLIIKLKNNNLWENCYVIILGLKGTNNYNRIGETEYTNLHSENTKISLFIKPPRMKGDEGISWKVDDIVNLNDIGYTLKKMFNVIENNKVKNFHNVDLNKYILMEKNVNQSERQILIESPDTWKLSPIQAKFAILNSETLGLEKNNAFEFYNLLLDSFEATPIDKNENLYLNTMKTNLLEVKKNYNIQNYFLSGIQNFKAYDKDDLKRYKLTSQEVKNTNEEYSDCISLINEKNITIEKLKLCKNQLFLDYLKTKHYKFYGLTLEKAQLNYEIAKKKYFEEMKIYKLNSQLENIWGLFDSKRSPYHGLMIYDPTFFN